MNPTNDLRNKLLHTLISGAAAHLAAHPHEAPAIGKGIVTLLDAVAPKFNNTSEPEAA